MEHSRRVVPHLGLPALMAGILLVLQIFAPAPPLTYVLAVLGGAVAIGYYWARQLAQGVSLERERRYGWAQVGDVLEERFTLRNESWLPALWAEVRDHSTLPGYTASRVTGVDGHSHTYWISEGECRRRGAFTLGPLDVTLTDPFGFFTVHLRVGDETSFVVYPVIAALPPLEMPRGSAPGRVRAAVHSHEVTPNASAVRPYVPGDTLRGIHWPTTARRDELYVKDYDREPAGDLWILLDLQRAVQAGEGEFSTEEYGITVAASLADAMLRQGRAVGLLCEGEEHVMLRPERGEIQLWRILSTLAAARASGTNPLGALVQQAVPVLGRGISASLITPSLDAEWLVALLELEQRGVGASVVLIDPVSFGGEGNLQAMLGLLSERGVPVRVIGRSFRFRPLIERRKQRPTYKVLGTGRVVVVPPT
ncbi:MAG: DUF58 domain-containing protein [Anaerolineae bacterium]|nr:DUF58 domain-containing protein [Anaerolineae bacterium]